MGLGFVSDNKRSTALTPILEKVIERKLRARLNKLVSVTHLLQIISNWV